MFVFAQDTGHEERKAVPPLGRPLAGYPDTCRVARANILRGRESTLRVALTAILLGVGSPAIAGGLYVTEIVTPTAVGTAGVSNVVNDIAADSAYTNPAGMTGLTSDAFVGGAQLLLPNNRFDSSAAEAGGSDGGNAGVVAAIPGLFLAKVPSERLRLGLSVSAPIGAGLDFGKNFVGRYGGYEAQLAGIAEHQCRRHTRPVDRDSTARRPRPGHLVEHEVCQPIGLHAKQRGLRGIRARSARAPHRGRRELAWFPATRRSRARARTIQPFETWYWG